MKHIAALILFIFTNFQVSADQVLKFDELKVLSQKTTAQIVFDEAKNISPNFGLSQFDEGLKSYFSKNDGSSFLCGPTTLAQFIIYHMAITKKLPINSKVPGLSQDQKSIDANQLIVELAKLCKTDFESGTEEQNYVSCVSNALKIYFNKSASIDWIADPFLTAELPKNIKLQNRLPTFSDIKNAIKKDIPLIAWVLLREFDPVNNKLKEASTAHIFPIFGYAYQNYFQNFALQINVTDPAAAVPWVVNQNNSDFSTVSAFRSKKLTESIFLDGRGFNGVEDRAYLSQLLIINIK